MPIGVPKVPCVLPNDPDVQWLDLYYQLAQKRVLFLFNAIDDEVANQLIGLILYLSIENPNNDLYLYINSPGGSLTSGIALFDMIRYSNTNICTICVGNASSMASFVLAGGAHGRRVAMPHARIMMHQPEGGSDGQASEVISESQQVMRLRRQVGKLYAGRTGQSLSRISRDMDRDRFMSAREAKEYGLVDIVASV